MIEAKKRENENLNTLRGQMKDMSQDFEDMKNARIASKQRLEQRFTNVYTEIQQNREDTTEQMQQLNMALNAFQDEFQQKLFDLGSDLHRQIEEEGQIFRKQWAANHARMDKYEGMLVQEKEDRIAYHDDKLAPVRAQLDGITSGLVTEKKTRIANEKKIAKEIEAECNQMYADIEEEKRLRKKRLNDLNDMLTQDTDLTNKFLNNFESQGSNEATKFMDDLESELKSRFEHQDRLLGNMSTFVTRFQQTLKIFGKDV